LANPKPGVKPPADEFLQGVEGRGFRPRSQVGYSREEEDAIAGHLRTLMGKDGAAKKAEVPTESVAPVGSTETDSTASRAKGKYPHEMRRSEVGAGDVFRHKHYIAQAVRDGKPVSRDVLSDYPDLAKKFGNWRNITETPVGPKSVSSAVLDPTPGRTEHLQAVASAAGHDELRDAADTVSRIEDIPHGERTADDRAELKRAKELAAAGGAPAQSSTGAKNPEKYVDDHPEVTADNPLGLPTRNNSDSIASPSQTVSPQGDSAKNENLRSNSEAITSPITSESQPQIVEPATPTGDLFNDYVPTAKRVESPEETAAKQKQATAAIEEAVGMKTVATREKEESKQSPDDHEKTIRDIKPGESAEINGHRVRRGKMNDETVAIDLPGGGVRTDTIAGASKYLAKRFPAPKGSPAKHDPDAPDTKTSHGKASAVPIGVTDKSDFKRKSLPVESPVYDLPL
jgi:hypothetical protein